MTVEIDLHLTCDGIGCKEVIRFLNLDKKEFMNVYTKDIFSKYGWKIDEDRTTLLCPNCKGEN